MTMSTGTIAASATSATDLMTLLNTALTGAGWVEEVTRTYTASIMGTTANCRVYTSAATTVASSIYTGTILSFEPDDTNARIRVRVCEKFDSSLSGAAAVNTKWAAPGNAESTAAAPTANGALSDSFVSHFQAAGTGQTVGWVEIATGASGYNYWYGANASRFMLATNSGSNWYVCIAGLFAYQGSASTAIGNVSCFLLGNLTAASVSSGSWTPAAASQAQVRVSREPGSTTSFSGHWAGSIGGPMTASNTAATIAQMGGPGAGQHQFYTETAVLVPAWVHGGSSSSGNTALRSNWGTIPEAVVLVRHTPTNNSIANRANFPSLGEQVVVGGTTYTSLGMVQSAPSTNISADIGLFVDGSQF